MQCKIAALEANVDAVVDNGAPVDAVSASPSALASLYRDNPTFVVASCTGRKNY